MSLQKQPMFRSRKYLDFVKSLDCCNCGAPADEAHHIIGIGGHSGMGMKPSDSLTMPVCRGCHTTIHNSPDMWERQYEWIALTLDKAIRSCKGW